MDNEHVAPERDDDALADTGGEELLDRLISDEMGEKIAQIMRAARRAQEAWHRSRNPDEGLRERKRRLTRQLISDAATTMFATRGFDNVKVSEVADRVGVSEKTVYNYFPTKESLVLDTADEAVERMARALRERGPDESLTAAVVRAIRDDMARFDQAPDELIQFIPLFLGMIDSTPALRAAWLEMHDRLANVARDELAAQAGIDPRDPEPIAAGRALAGLAEVALESRIRRIREGLRGRALQRAADDDLERAARLLETGLWSFNMPRSQRAKQQAVEAARAAEDARAQVLRALRQARAAWAEVRHEAQRQIREAHRESHRESQRQARDGRRGDRS
ncbi:MAG TPA: TetR family transcriptional regulator [Solirubrobacteraceae bacterium]|jgi:AcrR family transcriptional regulator|nr:TetR family transcriptional regulator [Solirubrobacteraceae bacterium]